MFASGLIYNHHQDKPDPYLEKNKKRKDTNGSTSQ
jgi:hypothetical protein